MACDGIALPDIDVGYFLYGLDELTSINRMTPEPQQIGARATVVAGNSRWSQRPMKDDLPGFEITNFLRISHEHPRPDTNNMFPSGTHRTVSVVVMFMTYFLFR